MKFRIRESGAKFFPEVKYGHSAWTNIDREGVYHLSKKEAEIAIENFLKSKESRKEKIHEYNPGKSSQQLLD